MQAPGRPDEELGGGFAHGGWAPPHSDSVMGRVMEEGMAQGGALLLGRRTYEDFAGFWPKQKDNPFTEVLNSRQKDVASTTLEEPLSWSNSPPASRETLQRAFHKFTSARWRRCFAGAALAGLRLAGGA